MTARYSYGLAFPHRLPDASGVAHVVEHLVGHGPADRRALYLLPELLDRGWLESFTGLTYRGFTGYVFTGELATMDAAAELIRQSCLDPAMDCHALAVECGQLAGARWRCGVVEDEIELRRSSLREAVSAATSAVYADDPLRHDPAGQPDLLRSLTGEAIRSFHRRWYTAQSMIARCAIEGEPFQPVCGDEQPRWLWQPLARQAIVLVARGQDAASGERTCPDYAICWRTGAFAAARRQDNLLTARCIAVALGLPDLRQRLAATGWAAVAGPIVDSTLPDPCVVAVLRRTRGSYGVAAATAAVSESLRSAVRDDSGLARLRGRAVRMTEPVVPEPWAARAVLALARGLAGSSPDRTGASDEELRAAILRCADGRPEPGGDVGGQPGTFEVRMPPAKYRAAGVRSAVPAGQLVVRAGKLAVPAGQGGVVKSVFQRPPTGILEYPDQGFELIAGTDSRRWPDGRMTMSVRVYPAGAQWRDRLAALADLWSTGSTGARLAPPRLRVLGTADGPRPFAEWSAACDEGHLARVLSGLAAGVEASCEQLARASEPSAPDPFLVAASLAGSDEAHAALVLSGLAIAGQEAVAAKVAPAARDVISIGVTGASPASTGDLWCDAEGIARRLHAAIAGLPASAADRRLSPVEVHRGQGGHWRLGAFDRPATAPPLTAYAILRLPAAAGSRREGDLISSVRQAMRDVGYYAVEGRVIPDWQLAVFTVHRPCPDPLVCARLAEAVTTAAELPANRPRALRQAGQPKRSGATPQAAAEALQRRLSLSFSRPPGVSPAGQVVPVTPTVLLAVCAANAL